MEFFCDTKDKTPVINQSFAVCEFTVLLTVVQITKRTKRKTKRTFDERCVGHAWSNKNSVLNYSTYLILPV